ncbi:MFS transporter [Falsiroseomonas sp.]|uniref:MFS transporter n=1 Tax=Falsiroseomonas sp. TaxID=2870721 RepID=UPI003F72BB76
MQDAAPSATALLRQAPFALFLGSRILSAAALQVQVVAVGWQVYELTDSALALGLVGLAQFLPMLLLTLVVGQVADRVDRRLLVGICRIVTAAGGLGLAWGSLSGWLDRDAIFALVVLFGTARAFEMPAQQALISGVVAAPDLPRAMAMGSSANQVATICGPALGGFLYALGGATAAYGVAALAFLLAGLMVLAIRIPTRPKMRGKVTIENLFSGITFIWSRPALLGAVSLDMVAVLLGGAAALFPIYAKDILQTGPWGLGLLRASPAIGALGMSLLLAWRPLSRHAGQRMFLAVMLFGLATIVFGLSRSLVLSSAALVVLGAADVVSVVVRQSLVQLATPDEMRGRVAAVNSLFIGTSNQLGEFESGVAAALLGPVAAVVLGGVGTVLVAIAWMRWFPALRAIDRLEDVSPRGNATADDTEGQFTTRGNQGKD